MEDKDLKFIKKIAKHAVKKNELNKFIVMDLETRVVDGILEPLCISWRDQKKITTLNIRDFKNSDDMIIQAINGLMVKKYSNYNIYLHNFSHFDAMFIIKPLTTMDLELKPIFRDSRIIKLQITSKKSKVKLTILDSYLLIPMPLAKAAKGFQTEHKGIFPYMFPDNRSLDYVGVVPGFEFFSKITKEEYDNYKTKYLGRDWNLMEELIKYCEQDVNSLWQVIFNFSTIIYELFNIYVLEYPTLPALAFAIFRSNFMEKENIALRSQPNN